MKCNEKKNFNNLQILSRYNMIHIEMQITIQRGLRLVLTRQVFPKPRWNKFGPPPGGGGRLEEKVE